jgi:putative flippase GtrA
VRADLRSARAKAKWEEQDFTACGKNGGEYELRPLGLKPTAILGALRGAEAEAPLFHGAARNHGARRTALRWLKFNAVGALGIGVQLAVLFGLKSGFHLSYLLATALSVEAAVVHNFLWHERYTWADRVQPSWGSSLPRLLRFNMSNGGVSIVGNLALMRVMVGFGHMNYLVANGIAIALCSMVNFLVSEEWVFA